MSCSRSGTFRPRRSTSRGATPDARHAGKLDVAEGDTVCLRLTADGLALDRVTSSRGRGRRAAGRDSRRGRTDLRRRGGVDRVRRGAALFTDPLPPLSEIVEEHGLAHRGEWLAPSGFDFNRWQFERRSELLAERRGLDLDDALVLTSLVSLYDQVARVLIEAGDADAVATDDGQIRAADGSFGAVGELGGQLADPLLAELMVAETVGADRSGAAALGLFAKMLEPRVPRAARVACRWLRAVSLDRIGDIDEAERELLAAESMDPDWPLPLIDLARIASDRGDVERGLALLRRAGAGPDHPWRNCWRHIEPSLAATSAATSRAGAGRPQIQEMPSGARAAGACRAGELVVREGHSVCADRRMERLLAEVGYERYRHTHDVPEALAAGMADPLVIDAVLFEGGAFAEFLEVRGSLLPDDERLLAEQWLLVDRSVFEVERVNPGENITVRDVRNGDVHEVRERTASRQLKAGQLICARVVPADDSMQFFGGVEPIALQERDRVIDLLDTEPDPVELVTS